MFWPDMVVDRDGREFWKAEAMPFLMLIDQMSSSGWLHTCWTRPSLTAATSGYRSRNSMDGRSEFIHKSLNKLSAFYLLFNLYAYNICFMLLSIWIAFLFQRELPKTRRKKNGIRPHPYCHQRCPPWGRWPYHRGSPKWLQPGSTIPSLWSHLLYPSAGPWTCRSTGTGRSSGDRRRIWGSRWRGIPWNIWEFRSTTEGRLFGKMDFDI